MSARVLPAVLGWANPTRDRENLRLYALDVGPSPRWAEKPIGRVAEQALRERGGHEGDRLLVVELDGGRWLTEADLDRLAGQVTAALTDDGPAARLTAVSAAHAWGCDCTDDDPCRIAIALAGGPGTPPQPCAECGQPPEDGHATWCAHYPGNQGHSR